MNDATVILSSVVAVIVILGTVVKLQSNLFEKMKEMMAEVVTSHSRDYEAHGDIRQAVTEHIRADREWKDDMLKALKNGYREK